MNKTVLIDTERARYPNTGLANVCANLVKGLTALGLNNTFTFYGNKNNNFLFFERWKPWHKFINLVANKYDVLHVLHQGSTYFPKYKGKKIVTLHDLNFLYEGKSDKKIQKEINIINKNLENTIVLVCISEFVKSDFLKHKNLFNYPKEMKIEVIYNGLDFSVFDTNIKSIATFFPSLKNKKFILNIGVINPKKNQLSLLFLLKNSPDLYLVLVYSSKKEHYKQAIINKAEELGVSERLLFLSNVTPSEKSSLLNSCIALVHPSKAEGFGIPPIEAMYLKKPVFVSGLTSLPEVSGNEAYYFTSFDEESMVKVFTDGLKDFQDNKLIKQEKLKDWAEKYNHIIMAKKYNELYKKVRSI